MTFSRVPIGAPELDALVQAVPEFVRKHGGGGTKDIAVELGRPPAFCRVTGW